MFLDRSKFRCLLSLGLSFCLLLFSFGVSLAAPSSEGSYELVFGSVRNSSMVPSGSSTYLTQVLVSDDIDALAYGEYYLLFNAVGRQTQGGLRNRMVTYGLEVGDLSFSYYHVDSSRHVFTGGLFYTHDLGSSLDFVFSFHNGHSSTMAYTADPVTVFFIPLPAGGVSEQDMTTFINNVNSSLTTINNNINNVSNSVSNLPSEFGNVLEQSNEQVYGSDDADVDSALDDLLGDMQDHLGFVGDLVVMPISILNQLMTGSASATVSAGTLNLLGASAPISFDFTFLDSLQPYFYTMTTAVCGFVLWQTLKDAYSYLFGVDV